ncbi:alkaline phosphatase family protein [Dictyocaulus viviparus]|uniref:Alkaline phosphatase n=1 Tax=Dictyocaulus viviparus TaxID=29172 RepID=A0A0D8XZG9_DICVI|nr:alkaline phosphatase family protein [Dictyocaulus viviparus]
MLIYVLYFLSLQQLSIAVQSSSDNRNNPYDIQFWNSIAKAHIDRKLQLNKHLTREVRPKNVVLFIGDGMGIAAVTSARINKNQKTGSLYLNEPLYFENFQSTGLVKTSSSNNHVTDSAAGATALFTGWKGVDRNFEFDGVTTEGEFKCTHDIAKQLLHYPASEFKVMMGGGREYLMEKSRNGLRDDGLNIDLNWQSLPGNRKVLRNILDFEEFSSASDEKLLGVFSPSHFPFYLEEHLAGVKTVPRLWEMTSKAIEHLQNGQNGYFLVVEGGMIDTAEHENMMHMTFEEIYEFEKAIKKAREMTDMNETLIIVTADHGHALTLPGYLHSNETIFGRLPN